MTINEDNILHKDFANDELALACLLAADVVFLNNVDSAASHAKHFKGMSYKYKGPEWTTCVYVNCNDTFSYASADAECVESGDGDLDSELIQLYKYWKESPNLGYAKFCSLKRKMKPLPKIVDMMKEEGIWTDELEKL